jgi:Protein of unknown function (DUF3052)
VTDTGSETSAGYSGKPLAEKLGLKPGQWVCYVNQPGHFGDLLGEVPDGVKERSQLRGPLDLIVCFVTSRLELARRLPALQRALDSAGMLWISWPKRSSGVETDLTEDHIRAAALPMGLVDTKVCAIDETWSGLRLVIRKELR